VKGFHLLLAELIPLNPEEPYKLSNISTKYEREKSQIELNLAKEVWEYLLIYLINYDYY